MNRLFPTLAFALLCALVTSLAVSWYLLEYPLFKANTSTLEKSLQSAADDIRVLLQERPESEWDSTLLLSPHDAEFEIDWFSLEDYELPIDDHDSLYF